MAQDAPSASRKYGRKNIGHGGTGVLQEECHRLFFIKKTAANAAWDIAVV